MHIKCWKTFHKKTNSTMIPASKPDAVYTIQLTEPCDIMTPNIIIGGWVEFSYCYITEWNRYYFVVDNTYNKSKTLLSLQEDYLASYKSAIGASTQYVTRAASKTDPLVIDTMYPSKTDPIITTVESMAGNPFTDDITQGTYIVGVINDDPAAIGSVSYYVFSSVQFRIFCGKLMGDISWIYGGISEISDELLKCLFNPLQYVASCMWFPFKWTGEAISNLKYGWWNFDGVACKKLQTSIRLASAGFTIPKHPQSGTLGEWVNASHLSSYVLHFPCVGTIPLDSTKVGNRATLDLQMYVDPVTGGATLAVLADGDVMYQGNCQIGVPIQLSQMATNYLGAVGEMGNVAGKLLKMDFTGAADSIGNAIEAAMPDLSSKGANGMTSAYHFAPVLTCTFYQQVEDSPAKYGRPLMQNQVIGTLSGFLKCDKADFHNASLSQENDAINSLLNGGIYYE